MAQAKGQSLRDDSPVSDDCWWLNADDDPPPRAHLLPFFFFFTHPPHQQPHRGDLTLCLPNSLLRCPILWEITQYFLDPKLLLLKPFMRTFGKSTEVNPFRISHRALLSDTQLKSLIISAMKKHEIFAIKKKRCIFDIFYLRETKRDCRPLGIVQIGKRHCKKTFRCLLSQNSFFVCFFSHLMEQGNC